MPGVVNVKPFTLKKYSFKTISDDTRKAIQSFYKNEELKLLTSNNVKSF